MKHLIYLLLLALHATQYVGGFPAGGKGNATDHVGNAGNDTDHVERVTQGMEPAGVVKNDTDPVERATNDTDPVLSATNDTDIFLLVNTKTGHNLSGFLSMVFLNLTQTLQQTTIWQILMILVHGIRKTYMNLISIMEMIFRENSSPFWTS